MDYGGNEKRRTKGDLKRKAKNRVYKRGGQFRTHEINETGAKEVKRDKMGKIVVEKKRRVKRND